MAIIQDGYNIIKILNKKIQNFSIFKTMQTYANNAIPRFSFIKII